MNRMDVIQRKFCLFILNRMKNKILSTFLLMLPLLAAAQEKKPTLMILPSDGWCARRYFMTAYDNQGMKVSVPDYQAAFREDMELAPVVSKVGELMTSMGYSIKDCEMELRALTMRQAEDNLTQSRASGAYLSETPLDMLKRRTQSDIIVQVDWHVNKEASGKSVTYTLEAFDAYTSKRIATATGTGAASNDIIPRLLENAVKENISGFDRQMNHYFADLQKNGREIVMSVRCWDNWENDLETEYDGEELTDFIQSWFRANTVDGQFSLTTATEDMLQFEQVRIPFFDEKGAALDARGFAVQLRKYLQKTPFGISSKVMTRGLGEAVLVLGEK